MNTLTAIEKKAKIWRDTEPTRFPETSEEVESIALMQGSFYPPRQWVGIHFCNMIAFNLTFEQMQREVEKRLVERPDLKPAYDLFMRPFEK